MKNRVLTREELSQSQNSEFRSLAAHNFVVKPAEDLTAFFKDIGRSERKNVPTFRTIKFQVFDQSVKLDIPKDSSIAVADLVLNLRGQLLGILEVAYAKHMAELGIAEEAKAHAKAAEDLAVIERSISQSEANPVNVAILSALLPKNATVTSNATTIATTITFPALEVVTLEGDIVVEMNGVGKKPVHVATITNASTTVYKAAPEVKDQPRTLQLQQITTNGSQLVEDLLLREKAPEFTSRYAGQFRPGTHLHLYNVDESAAVARLNEAQRKQFQKEKYQGVAARVGLGLLCVGLGLLFCLTPGMPALVVACAAVFYFGTASGLFTSAIFAGCKRPPEPYTRDDLLPPVVPPSVDSTSERAPLLGGNPHTRFPSSGMAPQQPSAAGMVVTATDGHPAPEPDSEPEPEPEGLRRRGSRP